ncbi:mRNA cleavage and polyadenylation specificity factor complex associated protein [Schizosaccharomyces japonicus yFS275]|uniref:mRNA cleavage and polyadenylation specificity factor complex associated protein n=1 Tax=Schizosaccharomyces japonicus (strain yFS275 / FY16936) TaxID=402676 RepID=B6K4E4_SCHJY|nr:mRNA cleavage and polyadenylation specificity factor complex associated protein [Schizosaccharomyces japonicus yFS275]EEB08351.2 mRNA cleavage and polyadenylation specificity factor complex associated protein [Schizosaccharomyces japonicus yFS275]
MNGARDFSGLNDRNKPLQNDGNVDNRNVFAADYNNHRMPEMTLPLPSNYDSRIMGFYPAYNQNQAYMQPHAGFANQMHTEYGYFQPHVNNLLSNDASMHHTGQYLQPSVMEVDYRQQPPRQSYPYQPPTISNFQHASLPFYSSNTNAAEYANAARSLNPIQNPVTLPPLTHKEYPPSYYQPYVQNNMSAEETQNVLNRQPPQMHAGTPMLVETTPSYASSPNMQPAVLNQTVADVPSVAPSSSQKLPLKTPVKPKAPLSPAERLRHELNECLDPFNTSRAPRDCAAVLVNFMGSIETDEQKLIFLEITRDKGLDTIYNELVDGSRRIFLPKLRNWFVSAIRSKHDKLTHVILQVLTRLPLNPEKLAEVKFGKAILLVGKKSTNSIIRQYAENLSGIAEKSLLLEQRKDTKAAPVKPETTKTAASATSRPSHKSISQKPPVTTTKKVTSVSNTSFFKNLSSAAKQSAASGSKAPMASSASAKSSTPNTPLSAIMAGLNRGNQDSQTASSTSSSTKVGSDLKSLTEQITKGKEELPSFRKRSAKSDSTTGKPTKVSKTTSESTVKRKKKSVSWRPDNDLVQVRIIESLEDDKDLAKGVHHHYGSARDLDRHEARVAFGAKVEDDVEEEQTWYEPVVITFVIKDELHTRGFKTGAEKLNPTPESQWETERESSTKPSTTSEKVLSESFIRESSSPSTPAEIPLPAANEKETPQKDTSRSPSSPPRPVETRKDVNIPSQQPYSAVSAQHVSSILAALTNASAQAPSNRADDKNNASFLAQLMSTVNR